MKDTEYKKLVCETMSDICNLLEKKAITDMEYKQAKDLRRKSEIFKRLSELQ